MRGIRRDPVGRLVLRVLIGTACGLLLPLLGSRAVALVTDAF